VVSARSWAAIDARTGDRLWSKGGDDLREVASLTKIMTALVTWELAKKFKLNPFEECIMVSFNATDISGTSAGLKAGDTLNLWDLLHGLLLPSGNDAAVCIAEYLGGFIYDQRKREKKQKDPKSFEVKQELFVKAMNKKAKALNMRRTVFWNPHGLHQKNNSTANDLNYLCFTFKHVDKLREIVKKRIYITENLTRKYVWTNTNLLLENEQYEGLKTGTTPNAGRYCY
jgi:serine-type D-Ala-D-Ala carboxypeptidase (penicillin-binding protein 5/6)